MARPGGVVIVSERFWAFAGRDGSLREGVMPAPPRWLHHVPLAPALWTPLAVTAVALGATMEVWRVAQARQFRFLLAPGLALQRLTTREPALADTRVALHAVESVLRRELA